MGKGYRQERIGEEIRKIVSDMLLRDLKDPRLDSMVSVTAVKVTSDGSYATLFLTVFQNGDEDMKEKKENVLEAMKSAKGLIKKEIGNQMKLRHTPDLIFKFDTSFEYGKHIEELLNEVIKDEEK